MMKYIYWWLGTKLQYHHRYCIAARHCSPTLSHHLCIILITSDEHSHRVTLHSISWYLTDKKNRVHYVNHRSENLTLKKSNWVHIDDLVRDCSISIANALEILQSCTKPSIYPQPYTPVGTPQTWRLPNRGDESQAPPGWAGVRRSPEISAPCDWNNREET